MALQDELKQNTERQKIFRDHLRAELVDAESAMRQSAGRVVCLKRLLGLPLTVDEYNNMVPGAFSQDTKCGLSNAKATKPVKAKAAKKAAPKSELKAKGWPKGMPRDKEKRAVWFETEAGKQYLAENPGSKAQ